MEFANEAQRSCYEKVASYLREVFGDSFTADVEFPRFGVKVGSALIIVFVEAWGAEDAVVVTKSWLVRGADVTADLTRTLLEWNDDVLFGAFGIDSDGQIYFQHAIVGSSLDREELRTSILAVGTAADQFDDKIVERWGGSLMYDR